MHILVVEDNENRIHAFRSYLTDIPSICTTAQEAITALGKQTYDIVYLDHDLGGEEGVDPRDKNTGSEVVRYLVAADCPVSKETAFIVHTHNSVEGPKMVFDLERAGFNVRRIPYSTLLIGWTR